jgi:hypothetical protein
MGTTQTHGRKRRYPSLFARREIPKERMFFLEFDFTKVNTIEKIAMPRGKAVLPFSREYASFY